MNVSALLRELILHVSRRAVVDPHLGAEGHAIGLLLNQLGAIEVVPLQRSAQDRLPRGGLALLGAITSFARSLLTRHQLGALSSGLGHGWFAGVVFEPGGGK